MDPEEIFRMFFGGGGFGPGGGFYQTPNGTFYRTFSTGFPFHDNHFQHHQQQHETSWFQRLLPILSIIIYIVLSLFVRGSTETPYK